ncbi:hypothetical protein LSTR_LSTR012153 [Laodelphax striatellus]|uniref:C2H2-type domain-containing protein n=1 Tax=Laodelphax striatellus TaxID=195883 RepID=A0A482X1I4_LAOST|nr:hypothetical protein LSTR_LSTR012153 [Laodelphax striatellus]
MHQYPEVMLNVEIDSDRTDTSLCENDNRLYSCRFCSYSSSHSGHLESHERTHTGDDETYVENVLLKECYVKCEMVEDDEPNEEEEEEGEEVELDEVGGGGEGELELEMDNADEGGGGGRVEEEEMGRDNFDEGEREEEEEEVMERDDVGEEEEEEEDDSNEIEVDVNYSVLDKNPVHSILLNPGQKPSSLTCSYCSKEFSRRFSLIRHTRQVHVGEARQHCKFCERKYVRRDHLKKHLMAHLRKVERQRQKNCFDKELCEKEEEIRFELDGFAKKSANPFSGIVKLSRLKTSAAEGSWANQVQVVTGFDCRYCGDFTCDTRSELIAHEKSHGYRGFQCTYCDATFSRQHHLSRHVSSHTGERQFSCHMCDKSFYRKDHLDKHLRVHTGEKPFQCSFCDKTFGRQYTMRDHEKKHAEALLLNVQSPSKPLIEVCATDDKSLNT